jgi:cytochrome P450
VTVTTAEEEALAFNPFDPEFRRDPYPTYARLRDEDPVHESPMGFKVLSRYADCTALLRDPHASSDETKSPMVQELIEQTPVDPDLNESRPFLFMDPPDHTRLRGLVSKAFTPRTIERLRPRIQQVTDELLAGMALGDTVDVIERLAYPVPVVVISEMLGVPAADEERFRAWSRALARSLDPDFLLPPDVIAAREEAILEFREYFARLIAERRRTPRDDLLTALVQVEESGDSLSENELLSICVLLLVAGHETTVNLIANGVLALARHPDQQARLRGDPALAKSAVEEVLRYDPPVQLTGRLALEPIKLPSTTMAAGDFSIMLLGAANHDPAQFPDADRFDIGRSPNAHIAFSLGHHFCLGASLARLEGQIALASLVQRFPSIELAADTLDYKDNLVLRGLVELPVTFSVR